MDVARPPTSGSRTCRLPFDPHYADVVAEDADDTRGRSGCTTWTRGRPTGRCPAAARPADVVLPLPEGHPRPGRRRAPRDRAGQHRVRPLRQADVGPDYTFARHIAWTRSLVTQLDLRDITLVAQDWGGPIGFGVLADEPDRFARVVAANTILHTADPGLADRLTGGQRRR